MENTIYLELLSKMHTLSLQAKMMILAGDDLAGEKFQTITADLHETNRKLRLIDAAVGRWTTPGGNYPKAKDPIKRMISDAVYNVSNIGYAYLSKDAATEKIYEITLNFVGSFSRWINKNAYTAIELLKVKGDIIQSDLYYHQDPSEKYDFNPENIKTVEQLVEIYINKL